MTDRDALTIRSLEALRAIPDCTVVRAADGRVWERGYHDDDSPSSEVDSWYTIGYEVDHRSEEIALPALVLWLPDDKT